MKVGIVGFGFVGRAISDGFNKNVEIFKVDPKLNTALKDLIKFNPEIIFLCLPTPMSSLTTNQDTSILDSVIDDLSTINKDCVLVLKSTVLPNKLEYYSKNMPNLVYNPEFLREKSASEDFINSDLKIFGGAEAACIKVSRFYLENTRCLCKDHIFTDIITASLVKYSINTFLATKVTFFNELFNIFKESRTNGSWKNFINMISKDSRIGSSHMDVPGHDGRQGFGGACLPKDSSALYEYSKLIDKEFSLLSKVIEINNSIRSLYTETNSREKEQNIIFNKKD